MRSLVLGGLSVTISVLAAVGCSREHREIDPRCVARDAGIASERRTATNPVAPPEPAPAVGGWCDGSNEPKLLVTTRSVVGAVGSASIPYDFGAPMLVVDGRCHYYALDARMDGIREGQLAAEEREQITRELAMDELASLPSSRDECADHWEDTLIATSEQSLRCACAECTTESATAAMTRAQEWITRLAAAGEPSAGSLRAFATPREPVENPPPWRVQTVLPWPLDEPMHAFPGLVNEYWTERGVRFDGAEAAALRKVRERSRRMRLAGDLYALASYVSDCGESYEIDLRDLLPDALAEQLEPLMQTGWARPKLTSCRSWQAPGQPVTQCNP